MRETLPQVLHTVHRLVLDGSMSIGLEEQGCTLGGLLWTARLLAEDPEKIKNVHVNYFRAGADCGMTCSYQASVAGFMKYGYTAQQAEALIRRSVELFREARDEWWAQEGKAAGRAYPLCLASCGPYGAFLADGSEYRGRYGVPDTVLHEFHQCRAELLWEAGADILLFETQPSLHEVLIEAEIAEQLGAPYWISFSCENGERIWEGDRLQDCAATLANAHPHLVMLGVNCTPPAYMTQAIQALQAGAPDVPVAVYPNSGETYDAAAKTWSGLPTGTPDFDEYARAWYAAGAAAVGGCCRTGCKHIAQIRCVRDELFPA